MRATDQPTAQRRPRTIEEAFDWFADELRRLNSVIREHTSKARAAALVPCPEIMSECVLAYERTGPASLDCLHEAQRLAIDLITEINAAIATELARQPQASPFARRIQAAATEPRPPHPMEKTALDIVLASAAKVRGG